MPLSSSSTLPRSQRQSVSLMTEEIDALMSQQNPLPGCDSGLNHHSQFKKRACCSNRICSDPIDDRCSSEQMCGMSSNPSSNRRNAKFSSKKSHALVRDKVLHIIPHTCLHEAPPTLVVGGTVKTKRQVGLQPWCGQVQFSTDMTNFADCQHILKQATREHAQTTHVFTQGTPAKEHAKKKQMHVTRDVHVRRNKTRKCTRP